MKVKTRIPVPSIATSGRWSKKADGEWGFDFDDPPKAGENEENSAAALQLAAAHGKLRVDNSDDDDEEADAGTVHSNQGQQQQASLAQQQQQQQQQAATNQKTVVGAENNNPIHLVLRMRDEKRELQDIKFDFLPKDTVDEISHELVNAQLIDAIDMIAVSSNLSKLLENNSLSPITFPLVSPLSSSASTFLVPNP